MGRNGASNAEAVRLQERLRRLNEASLLLVESLDFDHVLQVVADSARKLTGGRFGGITVMDPSGEFEAFVASGLTADEYSHLYELPHGIVFVRHLMALSDPLRVPDLGEYFGSLGLPEFRPQLDMGPALVASIRCRGESVGTIYVSRSGQGTAFTDEDESTLAMFATQAALVIANARRHRDEHRARAGLETLINTSPVGVMMLDARLGNLQLSNRELLRITGGPEAHDETPAELLERLVVRRADGREFSLAEHPLGQLLSSGETVRAERIVLTRPGGSSTAVLVNATPIRDVDGKVASAVVTVQDLTPLEELDRLRADILGLASEELRMPLVSTKGSAAMLLASQADLDPAESNQLARIIDTQADLMRELIGELRDMAQIHTGTLPIAAEPAELARLINDAAQEFRGNTGDDRIIVDVEPNLEFVSADQRRIARVLRSVLTDAFVSSDGTMPVRVVAARDGSVARVSVTHCGAAPAARLAGLFDKRSRHRPDEDSVGVRRSELDLAISKGIVEAHGGRIWADLDEPAGETRVSFTLPFAHPPQSTPAADTPRPTARPTAAARILVLDVDPQTQRQINDTLIAAGYRLAFAADAAEALADSASNRLDLVLAGVAHPAIDSVEDMRAMRISLDASVIFVVDYGLDEDVLRAVESGAADYIVKPFSPTELLARVRAALHRRAAPAPEAPPLFELGDLTVDFASRAAWVNGRQADLTETEFRLLSELAANPGRVLSYSQLMHRVWKSDSPNPAGQVRSAMKRLRRKLEDDARDPAYIFTVPRAGYRIGTPQRAATPSPRRS